MNRWISLVTGWAGEIGTAILRWFRKAEWSVNGLDRQWCPGGLALDEYLEGDVPSIAVRSEAVNIVVRDQVVQSWDVATSTGETNDYSVCTTWLVRKKDHYLLHVLRDRLEHPALKRKIISMARAHGANSILIENAGIGQPLIQALRTESSPGVPNPIGIKPDGDKLVRMEAQTAKIEAGQVFLPKDAPWLGDFLDELLAFPKGRHDDQVDSVSQFLNWAGRQERNRRRVAGLGACELIRLD